MLRKSSQQGFTLVELSVVLVVIGLIIGSILVASNILTNARVTNTVNLMQSIQAAYSTYNQNYNAVPGDDAQAATRFANNGVTLFGGGDGVVGAASLQRTFDGSVAPTSGNGGGESSLFWADLRAAGLVKGQGTQLNPPGNPFGGVIGAQNGAYSANGIDLGTNVLCLSNVPGSAAQIIDQRLDDGSALTGNMRGGPSVTDAAAEYADGVTTTLCMGL